MTKYDERDDVADNAKQSDGKTDVDFGDVSQQYCSVVSRPHSNTAITV